MRWPFIHAENTPTGKFKRCEASIPGPQLRGTGGTLSSGGDLSGTGATRRVPQVSILRPGKVRIPTQLRHDSFGSSPQKQQRPESESQAVAGELLGLD